MTIASFPLIEDFARAVALWCHSHPGEERRSAKERADTAKHALVEALSSQSLSLSEAREEIERLKRKLAEQEEATAFADENRTFQIERAEKAEATARDLRRLLKVNNDPPKPGFHCACAYHMQTAEQVQECGAHADLRARAEKAECEWDAALKSARFWEERHYAQMDAISAAIGSTRFMDPPDGGDVSLADQIRRMRAELEAKEQRLAALENGPAVLADAHTNPSLSSLRKGAGVVGWQPMSTAPKDGKHCILSVPSGAFFYSVQGAFQNGQWNAVHQDNVNPVAWMPNTLLPDHLMPAALVSGSREDGDG